MWKICSSNWESSPNRGENKEYLKPPPRSDWIRTTCHQNHRFPPHLRVCVFVNSPPLPISHPHLPTSRFAASALAANILQEVDSKSSICPLSYLRFSKSFEERLGSWKLESHLKSPNLPQKKSCQRFFSQIGKILKYVSPLPGERFCSFGRTWCVCFKLIKRWESCQKVFPQSFGKPNIHWRTKKTTKETSW